MSNQHVLKIHPAPLADLMSGAKTAEVRRNDRDFRIGDTVCLIEVNPETDNDIGNESYVRTISHIQTGYGLPDGMCVLSYADTAQREALAQLQAEMPDLRANMTKALDLLQVLTSTKYTDRAFVEAVDDADEMLAQLHGKVVLKGQAEQQEAQGAMAGDEQEALCEAIRVSAKEFGDEADEDGLQRDARGDFVHVEVRQLLRICQLYRAALATQPPEFRWTCINHWFLSLDPNRQESLLENKWALASAAFDAGQSIEDAVRGDEHE